MYGLPKTDLNEIKQFFDTRLNIATNGIFEIKTKSNDPNTAIYLFHFNKKDISMQVLNKIKVVNQTIVKWAPYSPKFKGPTQCRLCTMYGHCAENCHRKKICIYCASSERESAKFGMCPTNANASTNVNGAVFKCFSCSAQKLPSNHPATDRNCPARNTYLAIRQKLNSRNAPRQPRNSNVTRNTSMQNLSATAYAGVQ